PPSAHDVAPPFPAAPGHSAAPDHSAAPGWLAALDPLTPRARPPTAQNLRSAPAFRSRGGPAEGPPDFTAGPVWTTLGLPPARDRSAEPTPCRRFAQRGARWNKPGTTFASRA